MLKRLTYVRSKIEELIIHKVIKGLLATLKGLDTVLGYMILRLEELEKHKGLDPLNSYQKKSHTRSGSLTQAEFSFASEDQFVGKSFTLLELQEKAAQRVKNSKTPSLLSIQG